MSVQVSAYTQAFERLLPRIKPADRGARTENLRHFLADGFPGKRVEEWRYTDLAPLAQQAFVLADERAALPNLSAHLLEGCQRVVFVNGLLRPDLGSLTDPELIGHRASWAAPTGKLERDTIAALNQAFATDGLVLRLPAGYRLEQPLQVLLVSVPGAAPAMCHLNHSIQLEPGASARVLIQHIGASDAAHFTTHALYARVMQGASLEICRIQEEGAGTSLLFRGDTLVERDAQLSITNVDLGGGLTRNDWNVNLAAPQASVALQGLYAPGGTSHVDNHTRIDHYWPRGTSRELFRGIVSDQARAVFNGKIVVHPNAQKTDSEQRVANLILSKGAEVYAKPELEIYANDVKCAHGATFGQIDENAVFYLRSRGLSPEMARAMLTYTFAYEVLGKVADPALRRLAERRFLARLPAEKGPGSNFLAELVEDLP